MFRAVFLLFIASCCQASPVVFNLTGDSDASVIYNGNYYLVESNPSNIVFDYPIYESVDLSEKALIRGLFGAFKLPSWATYVVHVSLAILPNGQFRAYFASQTTSGNGAIGVATAENFTGPYRFLRRPLLDLGSPLPLAYPQVFIDKGKPILLYEYQESAWESGIFLRELTDDGLGLSSNQSLLLIKNDRDYEGNQVSSPYMVKKGNKYHLFYAAGSACPQDGIVTVASSTNINGPYAKNENFVLRGPGITRPAILKNVLTGNDIQISVEKITCGGKWLAVGRTLTWDEDNKPVIEE